VIEIKWENHEYEYDGFVKLYVSRNEHNMHHSQTAVIRIRIASNRYKHVAEEVKSIAAKLLHCGEEGFYSYGMNFVSLSGEEWNPFITFDGDDDSNPVFTGGSPPSWVIDQSKEYQQFYKRISFVMRKWDLHSLFIKWWN